MQTYKAAKYIRISHSDDKNIESDSVANQRKLIDEWLKNRPEIEVVAEMVDDGISGIIFDRPAFKEMMSEIEQGKINCCITKDLSRLGREYIETGRYLRRIFPAYGVRFIAINDNIDTLNDNADDLVVSVKSIINDAYCRDISIKTRSALNVKRDNGDYVGACPVYGYKKSKSDKNLLEIDEYPASVVRDIFQMKLSGMSAVKIADKLNSNCVLSPLAYKKFYGLPYSKNGFGDTENCKWSATTIIRILSDETYTGNLVQGKLGTLNYKLKDEVLKPICEWKRAENTHEFIIKKEDFELVQRIMKLDTRTSPNGENVYLFSGILICGCCGERMKRKIVYKPNKKHFYYWCPTTKKGGCTHPSLIRESDLIECVLDNVKSKIANIADIETVLQNSDSQRILNGLKKQYLTQISENEQKIQQIHSFKSSLYENMINGILTKEDYKTLKLKYQTDEENLKIANEKLQISLAEAMSGNSEKTKWMARFRDFSGITELDRRTVVNLIQSIKVISKTELQITFNYQDEFENILQILQKKAA